MSLNVLKDLRRIYTGLNADEIRGAAWQDVTVGLMATTEESLRAMELFLAPQAMDTLERSQALRSIHRAEDHPGKYDVVLCEPGIPVPRNGYLFDPAGNDSLLDLIVSEHHAKELAIARTFPRFRACVAGRIVNRVARENAMFALVTALPNFIPTLIELPWAVGEFATDTAFLTMNQVRMAFQLAAAAGRPVGYAEQKLELATIAAGAFGWRAIARELVGKIPMGGGLIPKSAIAFAGTWVVGMGLEQLYRTGAGFSRSEHRRAWKDGFTRSRNVLADIKPESLRTDPIIH